MDIFTLATNFKARVADYVDTVWERRDKRVEDWFLMSSSLPMIAICIIYVYLVKVWGPNFMKNREPFQPKKFLLVYNAFQVISSSYLFVLFLQSGWLEYSFFSQAIDYTEKGYQMIYCLWITQILKYVDMIDTFCFVARKKFNQVSVLHVYHHSVMTINVWIGLRFMPGGHGTFVGPINSFVHIVMYSYYLIAGLGPQYQKYLWWKAYVTKLQLAQFVLVLIHSAQLLISNDCNYPIFLAYLIIAQAIIFFALFSNFYIKAYLLRGSKKVDGGKNCLSKEGNNNEKKMKETLNNDGHSSSEKQEETNLKKDN